MTHLTTRHSWLAIFLLLLGFVPLPGASAAVPTGVSISSITSGNGYLEVAFSGGTGATAIEYSVDGGITWNDRFTGISAGSTATWSPLTIHGLTNGQQYSVKLRGKNTEGIGTESSAVDGTPNSNSRISSNHAFLQGAYVEVGVRPNGAFGSNSGTLTGFHPSNSPCLGFRVDRQKNGWGTSIGNASSGFTNIDDGDYFCPGSPYEGWSLKVGSAGTDAFNSHSDTSIRGQLYGLDKNSTDQRVVWSGSAWDGIVVTQTSIVPNSGQSLHVDVTLKNVSDSTKSDIFYGRGYDPDNETGSSAGGWTSASINKVNNPGGTGQIAEVQARFDSGAKVYLRSIDSRARASARISDCCTPSLAQPWEVWNSSTSWSQSTTELASFDRQVAVAVKVDSLAAGESTTFRISYVLTTEDASSPSVTTGSATSVGAATTATLNGTVNANGQATSVEFEYGTDSDLSGTILTAEATPNPVEGSTNTEVSANLTGLSPGTTYYYRVKAQNDTGTSRGTIKSFTPIASPLIIIEAANGISENEATLNGYVNPRGGTVGSIFFTLDTQNDFGSGNVRFLQATPNSVTGTSQTSVSLTVGSLDGGVTYYYKLTGTNEASTESSETLQFTTTPAPLVTTGSATSRDVPARTINLNGSVNTYGTATGSLYFELSSVNTFTTGSTALLRPTTDFIGAGSTGTINLVTTASSLLLGTTYYYRLFAGNTSGVNYGVSNSFILTAAPTVTTGSASTSGTTASLTGSVNPNGAATSSIRFYYSTTALSIGSSTAYVTASPSTLSGNTESEVTGTISGLTAGNTYYYRIVSTNSDGTSAGETGSFTLDAADTSPPEATISAPATGTSATTILVTISFNEATTGFDNTDLLLSGSSGGWSKSSATSVGSAYEITLTPSASTGGGNLVLSVPAGAARDTSRNLSLAATPVTVTITEVGAGAVTYTITYYAGSAATGSPPSSGNYTSGGASYTILGNTGSLARTGYTVTGWNTQAGGGGTSYFAGSAYASDANLNLYPLLSANTYSITYLAGSATSGSVPPSGSYTTGSTAYTILGNTGSLERTFCTFGGWNTQSGGGGVSYFSGSTYASTSNLSLYPLWTGCTTYPDAPTSLIASATGETTATLSFTAPASDGGMTIISYTFTSTPGSVTATYSGSGSGTVTFTGLSPGTTYTFIGYATNNNGNSVDSTVSNSITTYSVGLTPTFDSPVPTQGGFSVNITNYNLNYSWSVAVSGGYEVELLSGGAVKVTGINNSGYEATVTVTTSRTGFSNKSGSVAGASRSSSPEVNLKEIAPSRIAVQGSEITCICGQYSYVSRGWLERSAEVQGIIYILYLDDSPVSVSKYDPRNSLASWLAPSIAATEISSSATRESAIFQVYRDYRSARCEFIVFESPTIHLSKSPTFFR